MPSILPGRPQSTRQALSTVNWDGLRLVAYISGNNAIIFNGRREILAYLSIDEVESLYALSIQEESGNIALCDSSKLFIYTPSGRDYGDLRWTRTHEIDCSTHGPVTSLSWGSPDELLVAGRALSLWNLVNHETPHVMWNSTLSSPIAIAQFSPDAGLIASCGEYDRMVKIWRRLSYEQDSTRFDVSYLPHPSAVLDIHWRKVWHHEQTLDNLLYTYCADKQVRVWSHSDHHMSSLMQMVSIIDTNESIQPRRLSMGSVSKNRFVFILHSRDLSRAAERALQTSRLGTGHALEHLIEIANRSPEICVVLDGLGHMSAWGLENAGYKNKQTPEKFNVALVDGVNIVFPSTPSLEDHVQMQAFANNDASASLCILVHSHSGQIDWYQGSFTEFFDTAARQDRILLQSSWSGHASGIDKVTASPDQSHFMSWTDTNRAIAWSQSATGALIRRSRLKTEDEIIDAILLDKQSVAMILLEDVLEIWDVHLLSATRIQQIELLHENANALVVLDGGHSRSSHVIIGIIGKDCRIHFYEVSLAAQLSLSTNGHHNCFTPLGTISFGNAEGEKGFSNHTSTTFTNLYNGTKTLVLNRDGRILTHSIIYTQNPTALSPTSSFQTWIRPSRIFSACEAFAALVHENLRTLSIWNSKAQSCEFLHIFSERDEIQGLHWHNVGDGLNLLAVQSAYTVSVLAQRRYSLGEHQWPWKFLETIHIRKYSSNMIGSLCWVKDCRIVLSAGDQILAFDIDTRESKRDPGRMHSDQLSRNTIIPEIAIINSNLPIFHPTVVGSLIWNARYAAVQGIFEELRNQLRFTVEDDVIPSELNLNILKLVTPSESASHATNHVLNTKLDEKDVIQLQEATQKISRNQLSDSCVRQLRYLISIYPQILESRASMDQFGLAYLHEFLLSMSAWHGDDGEMPALPYRAIVALSLSKRQEALVHFVLAHLEKHNIKLTWSTARSLGLFLFLKPPTSDDQSLQNHLETVARNEYNLDPDDRNPVKCSLYYLALNRKNILQSLWRTTVGVKEKENTMKLLAHDFTQQKWKATALKNAYALLSRRRFEYAAAFFLLGGSLSDACNICVNQLHDIQLAVAIARVWSDGKAREQVLRNLTERSILDLAIDSVEARWLAIWGPIHRQNYKQAIQVIVRQVDLVFHDQFMAKQEHENDNERKNEPFAASGWQANEPRGLVEVYLHLRSSIIDAGQWSIDVVTPRQEWEFVMRCVQWYIRSGMSQIALALVANWGFVKWQNKKVSDEVRGDIVEAKLSSQHEPALKSQKRKDVDETTERRAEVPMKAKPPPTQFVEPSANSLLDSFGF